MTMKKGSKDIPSIDVSTLYSNQNFLHLKMSVNSYVSKESCHLFVDQSWPYYKPSYLNYLEFDKTKINFFNS